MKKNFLVLLLVATVSMLLVACGGTKEDTIKVWAPKEEQELLATRIEAFKEANPDFEFKYELKIVGNDQSISEIKKDQDVAADIFMYPSGGISELTTAGLILPITVGVDDIKAAHSENSIKSASLDGVLYGVPVTPNSFFMYYNKSIFTEEEVKSLNTMLEKDLPEGTQAFSTSIANSWFASSFYFTVGNRLFGENGTDPQSVDFNNAQGVKVSKFLMDLAKNPMYLEDEDGVAGNMMKEGKLGALTSGVWSASDLKEQLGDNYAATKLPTITIEGETYQMRNFVDYKVYGVNSATKYPELAIKLATWFGNAETQLMRFEETNDAPTVKELLTHEKVTSNIEVSALLFQEQYGVPQPSIPQLANFWDPFGTFGSEIVNGTVTLENLQSKLDAMVAAIKGE